MEKPLLPESEEDPPKTPIEPVELQTRQTGGKDIPKHLYAKDVAHLVLRLEKKDKRDMGKVQKFSGFTENAYRYVFAYEDKFKEVKPHLQTIMPTGKIENDKFLKPEPERGIIAYTKSQKMLDKKTALVFQARRSPFVFEKAGDPYVMQTWPTKFNDKFKEEFKLEKYPNNPDPEHFEEEALEDFKRVALTLFERSVDEDPPLWLGVRKSENNLPMYQGTGFELMALLRLRHDIREDLRILEILEPDGFLSKFTDGKQNEGEKPFHMDLSRSYCLYTKQGWETMACVKPLEQFNWEADRYPEEKIPPAPASDDGVINFPLDMEWVSGPAYVWTWLATAAIWGGAAVTVIFAFFFYNRADWWNHGVWSDFWQHLANTITAIIILAAVSFGLYADDKAMSYCILPWLQNVEKSCMIPIYGQSTCNHFRYFSLACTMSQMLTIQLNAWVLANTVRNSNCNIENAYVWLWNHSGVGFCPINLIYTVLFFWGLTTLQFFIPSFLTLANIPLTKTIKYIKEKVDLHRPIDNQSYKLHFKSMLSGTLAEGVTLMALASGMRYTGAVSLSYPLAMIKHMKDKQIGFMIKTEAEGSQVWEQTKHGWEFRCVKELEKLYTVQAKRLWFLLFFKYSWQMNVQVTLFILKGTLADSEKFNYAAAFGELLSIGAMSLGIASELWDLKTLLWTFWDIRSSVLECFKKKEEDDKKNEEDKKKKEEEQNNNNVQNDSIVDAQKDVINDGKEDMLARHFYKDQHGKDQEETITFADLNYEYYRILATTVGVVLVTLFSMFLIAYEMLKFANFWRCPDGIWQWSSGCLENSKLKNYLHGPKGVCNGTKSQ